MRSELSHKRVRVYAGGQLVADSRTPTLVWEIPYYPTYYLPAADVLAKLEPAADDTYDVVVGSVVVVAHSSPSSSFAAQCGSVAAQNHWLRSWTHELYLWYREVPDLNPAHFSTTAAYFELQKTTATTASGNPKDKFHFTFPTAQWLQLSQSGVQAGYGAEWVIVAEDPPRRVVVAYTQPNSQAVAAGLTRGAEVLAVDGADIIIEAVVEDLAVKNEMWRTLDSVCGPETIFASNTSTIPITSLATNSKRPKQFIGIHFFSPVDRMMLVEIIMGEKTGDKALAVAIDYVRAIRKTPIVVNDTRGFYVNRCVLRYMSEAFKMLIEGVPAPMIENAAKMAGMPVGPLALTDETAIDLAQKIMKQTVRDLGEAAVDPKQFELINTMVDTHGRHGRKNGKGFYDYPEKPAKKHLWPGLKELYPQQDPDTLDVEELKQRFLVVIALEAARVMEEGIVTDPREADVGSILAFGFAPYTGGALSYIDGMGLENFLKLAKGLQKKYGAQFKAPKLLIDMAEKLGMSDVVELLEQNLQEEEMALNKLKAIASEFDVAEEEEEEATSRR